MVKVKVCGITRLIDAQAALNSGADALGFIFYKKSPRYISPQKAKLIIQALPPFISSVGVFVNSSFEEINKIIKLCQLSAIQLHGDELPSFCKKFKSIKVTKAFRIKTASELKKINDYHVDAYLLDAYHQGVYGGSGKTFDWKMLRKFRFHRPWILSGGLNSTNIVKALRLLQPWAVDVSSGVEKSPGVKDHKLIGDFLKKAKTNSHA